MILFANLVWQRVIHPAADARSCAVCFFQPVFVRYRSTHAGEIDILSFLRASLAAIVPRKRKQGSLAGQSVQLVFIKEGKWKHSIELGSIYTGKE